MRRSKTLVFFVLSIFLISVTAHAQKSKSSKSTKGNKSTTAKPATTKPPAVKTAPKVTVTPNATEDEQKVRDLVAFFQFMLNTLGSKNTSTRDKDVLITESYAKIFRDNHVQIEDDLDEDRKVTTNKDVVAYLKDVDYFFSDVKFEFAIEEVKINKQPSGEVYYDVVATRHLTGTNTDGESVTNAKPRHIEVNYTPETQDLKIVSVYTNEFNESAALTQWWNELSFEWKEIFRQKLNLSGDPDLAGIKQATSIQELDLQSNQYIVNIDPLAQLLGLRKLNLNGTIVRDLSPLRNLTDLEFLSLTHTPVQDLSPLKYAAKLKVLDVSFTRASDISVLEKMTELSSVNLQSAPVTDFSVLGKLPSLTQLNLEATKLLNTALLTDLKQLTHLNLSATLVSDISALGGLVELEEVDLDSTRINGVHALAGLNKLKVVHVGSTNVFDLSPLQKLPALEKVYCDQSMVRQHDLDAFRKARPSVLIVFDSQTLSTWWEQLPVGWQDVFRNTLGLKVGPLGRDVLARIVGIDSINIAGNASIHSLEPLRKMLRLRALVAKKTSVSDLSPLQALTELQLVDVSETQVTDVSVLSLLPKLRAVYADQCKLVGAEKLRLPSATVFYADQTSFQDILAREFLEQNPNCLLVYKTTHLDRWWSGLPDTWRKIFSEQMGTPAKPGREDLHKLVEQPKLQFKDESVLNLAPLNQFVRLKQLHISGSAITSVSVPENLFGLTSLHVTHSPVMKLDSLSMLTQLQDLNISDTPVDDLYPIWRLKELKKLNCSGTQIKRLDVLERLESLEYLDCSNTNVSKLTPLDYLPLRTLRCYNTRASHRAIENFKATHPECVVMYY